MKLRSTPRSLLYGIISLVLLLCMTNGIIISGVYIQTTQAQTVNATATIGGCPLFPANNVWNHDISSLPVHRNSANFIASIGLTGHLHPDFGAGLYNGGPIGIPYVVVPGSQANVPVHFTYASESDSGPYPIPRNAPIEGGAYSSGDRHVIVVNSGTCKLYEMFASYLQSDSSWRAGSGAVWNLNSNALRPSTWTSADAAGLPILPGLARYDEVAAGAITHALRFTVSRTQRAFIWPARHFASSNTNPNLPPMGLRLRLKASVNISSFPPQARIILTALKHYGMIVADNGSSWFISGAPDNRWNNDDLHSLGNIPGSDFEVVDESSLMVNPNSAQAGALSLATKAATTPTLMPTPTQSGGGLFPPSPANTPTIAQHTKSKGDSSYRAGDDYNGEIGIWPFIIGVGGIVLGLVVVFWGRPKRKRGVT